MKWFNLPIWKLRLMVNAKNNKIHPTLLSLSAKLVYRMDELGYKVGVFQGMRTWEEQDKLYAKGRTAPGNKVTNAKGGHSWHNFGLAIDVVFKKDGNWSWSEEHPWVLLGREGQALGLEWGGNWSKFKDRPHFQMNKHLTLSVARDLYKQGGLVRVWEELDVDQK